MANGLEIWAWKISLCDITDNSFEIYMIPLSIFYIVNIVIVVLNNNSNNNKDF